MFALDDWIMNGICIQNHPCTVIISDSDASVVNIIFYGLFYYSYVCSCYDDNLFITILDDNYDCPDWLLLLLLLYKLENNFTCILWI